MRLYRLPKKTRRELLRWTSVVAASRDFARRRLVPANGTLPIKQWLAYLDRIEQAAARMRTPRSFASEAYTLREHIALVRSAVMAKVQSVTAKT